MNEFEKRSILNNQGFFATLEKRLGPTPGPLPCLSLCNWDLSPSPSQLSRKWSSSHYLKKLFPSPTHVYVCCIHISAPGLAPSTAAQFVYSWPFGFSMYPEWAQYPGPVFVKALWLYKGREGKIWDYETGLKISSMGCRVWALKMWRRVWVCTNGQEEEDRAVGHEPRPWPRNET